MFNNFIYIKILNCDYKLYCNYIGNFVLDFYLFLVVFVND